MYPFLAFSVYGYSVKVKVKELFLFVQYSGADREREKKIFVFSWCETVFRCFCFFPLIILVLHLGRIDIE